MQLYSVSDVIEKIQHLYTEYGEQTYEEKCTQLQHAQQCGTLAIEWHLDEEVALAAFLHDIGHFLAQDSAMSDFTDYGYAAHDKLGAEFLSQCGFPEKLVYLVGEHVQVKRYLATIQAGYLEQLSHASKVTLSQQGGAMTSEEASQYAHTPHLPDIIQMRKIDDSGKLPERECYNLDFWLLLAEKVLTAKTALPAE